jgi:Fe2+ transport system protein FeoA
MNSISAKIKEVAAKTLAHLPAGKPARVLGVTGHGAIARRLLEMGVVPGAPVRVIKAAPLGDPLEVCVRNFHLALRLNEAATIAVQED